MTIMEIIIAIVLWFICGFINCGLMFAGFQRKYSSIRKELYDTDARFSIHTIPLGPLVLMMTLLLFGYRHGWLLPYSKASKTEIMLEEIKNS